MWCVAELDDEYIDKMEDVLETYEKPYDPVEPVVCFDEKPVTLHDDVRAPMPAKPGREARRDNEYERCGTANVFCAIEPKTGREDDPPGDGQSQQSYPQITHGPIRGGIWRRDLGPVYRSLHASARQLVKSGGN